MLKDRGTDGHTDRSVDGQTDMTKLMVAFRSLAGVLIQGVPKPISQTSPGYCPPLIKQKSSYQHVSKSEQVPRYPLTFMCGYPLSIT